MITIQLKFPAHRFHATPWGRHVNEGTVEWPPSPYRLVRALYDVWQRKLAEANESEVEALMRALAAEAPSYRLPLATASHTRSYLNSNTFDPTEKSLIFDAFVAMTPGASLYVSWPNVELTAAQRELLAQLLGKLNYLGRSESWVDAGLHSGEVKGGVACEPMKEEVPGEEMVAVACAVPADAYTEKRAWLHALTYSTAEFLKDRRSLPPAMRLVPYVRARNAVMARAPKAPGRHAEVQAVMLSLNARVLPLVTSTIEVAEQVRVRLMGIHKAIVTDPATVSPKFSGKMPDGSPRKDHQHAFILPLRSEKEPIRIDRVLVRTTAPEGFDHNEVRAILALNELYGRAAADPIRVMATQHAVKGEELRGVANIVASMTPFCSPRHWRKGRGTYLEFLAEDIHRECRNHGIAEPRLVERIEGSPFAWVEYRRNRRDEEPHAGYGFRLEFEKPLPVPFSLGYGCHFGLGQFDALK